MFDLRKYFEKRNLAVQESYEGILTTIRRIHQETKSTKEKNGYCAFLNRTSTLILDAAEHEKELGEHYFTQTPFDELLKTNNKHYDEITLELYEKKSYANPAYCVSLFGEGFGQLMSYFYCQYRAYPLYALYHQVFEMEKYNRLFVNVANQVTSERPPDYDVLKTCITQLQREEHTDSFILNLHMSYDKDFAYLKGIVENADLNDLAYLFRYGQYVSDNEIKTARLLQTYPAKKIKKLAKQIADAYIKGFQKDGKTIEKKSVVSIYYAMGQERIIRELITELKRNDLEAVIMRVSTSEINEQYHYDHRFDNALYLDESHAHLFQKNYEDAYDACKEMLAQWSGIIALDKFGRAPFAPKNKKEAVRLSPQQQQLFQQYRSALGQIREKYVPHKKTSFTLVSFPSPEIGENFEEIFGDIVEVNMLDTRQYECIQQKIIDVLDVADYVHVKGNNRTDITVKMHEITQPEKQTNFVNCGADINIPVGEVFTTPRLKGTHGVLHIEKVYLRGLEYRDLELTFKDGYVVDYMCKNFDSDKENKEYVEENLLFPHKTLPIGEFAIGTNTLAYIIAKKHNILHLLPVLIIEKMGPHFAIGDSCFALEEDVPAYNAINNKEVIARENEKSALRNTSMADAYAFKHIDITLPYESIAFISAITKQGEKIDIIRDGRFVIKGTEELNRPFNV